MGFCAAATFRPAVGMGGAPSIWRLSRLTGYMAPAEKEAMAASILNHMGRTFQVNPQWAMGQIQNEGATSQIISQTANQIADMAAKSQRSRDAVDDEISRRRSNAMLGVVDVVDSATGREIKVESGSNYYWIDQRGTIVGTETDTRPNVDFRALVQLP